MRSTGFGQTLAVVACALFAGCSGNIGAGSDSPFTSPGARGPDGRIDPDGPGPGSGDPGSPDDPLDPGAGGAGTGSAAMPDPDADPGRVTLHRLNRVEYANTVRDLLGTTQRPADDFPTDDRGYGYDNIADVLSLSPVQVEMYFNAATALLDEALNVVSVGARRFEAEAMTASTGAIAGSAFNLYSAGSVQQTVPIAATGTYRISVRAWAQQAGPEVAQMSIDVNALPVATVDVAATDSAPELYEVETEIEAGSVILGASFLNDFYDEAAGADRNLLVDFVEIDGPIGVAADNPLRARIMLCEPDATSPTACWRQVAESFGKRAWRRPLVAGELDTLVELAQASLDAGDDVETATRLMLKSMLVSPNFLFRVEIDPDPASTAPHPLNDYELASRLSYFLWSSMPDDTLFELADAGMLQDPDVVATQVQRMLTHEHASALLDNFAGQWLFIRALDDHVPDYATFPDFDATLRAAMRTETELFVREFLFGDESLDTLLTADFTFLNDRLAAHYGLPEPGSAQLERVTLSGDQRRGLLTQASLLTVTSFPTRTSPVKRGKWVLEQLLCSPPDPPPPGVEGLMQEETPTGSIRERMEQHRTNPVCASCHQQMDPIGFGFEGYDGIGQHRTTDQGFDIDTSGELPDGTTFSGPIELSALLAADARLPECMTEQLFIYALGRGPESYDDDDIAQISQAFVAGGQRFRELVELIAKSEAFRYRRGESAEEMEAAAMEAMP